MSPRDPQRGITLIEIIVAMVIITAMVSVVAVVFKRLNSTALRQEAVSLAAAMRRAYDHAASSGAYHRVVMDLDEQTYKVERCEGKLVIRRAADQRELESREQDEALRREQEMAQAQVSGMTPEAAAGAMAQLGGGSVPGESMGGVAGGTGAAACTPLKGEAGKPHHMTLSPKIRIGRVWVSHFEQPVTAGTVTLNFFPFGRAERAVVELDAGESTAAPDESWSVTLHPLNGRVVVAKGVPRNATDLVGEDAEGKRL